MIGSAKKLRGKVARTLAAKLAIAARLDYFGAGLSSDLQASLDARLRDIKQRGRNKYDLADRDQIYIQCLVMMLLRLRCADEIGGPDR